MNGLFGDLPPPSTRGRAGWTRFAGETFGCWQHTSGWQVQHCGHPTALWPYYGVSPEGKVFLSRGFVRSRAFQNLAAAQEAIEIHLFNEKLQKAKAKRGPPPRSTRRVS